MKVTTVDHKLWLFRLIITGLIAITVVFLCQQYVAQQMNEIQQAWQSEWRAQENALFGSLEMSGQTLAVSPITQLWLDRCTKEERTEYEDTLERLGTGLTAAELNYLASNFSRCGTRAADQSFAQAVALEREIAALTQWFAAAEFLPDVDTAYYQDRLIAWGALSSAAVNLQRAQYELDDLQRDLILARKEGAPVAGDRIQNLLQDVQAARQSLSEMTVTYRERLRELSL